MRVGMILPIQSQDSELDQLWEELRGEVHAAEDAGFDAVFLTEFHQARGGALVSPLLLGAGLLQGTSRIRFGSLVLATPLHHPVRLAEDAIMLDWITRGRVVLGLGVGHQPPDFDLYGVPRDERPAIFEEQVEVLLRCFSNEPFEFDGDHFQVQGRVTPAPFTEPRPPIWIGAHSDPGLERAARLGDRWMVDPQRDVPTAAELASRYREHAERLGRQPRVGMFREAWIGDSREECERVWGPHALAVHRLYYNVGVYREEFEPWVDEVSDRADFTLDRLAPGRFLYGSPTEIRETVRAWEEATGADYLALRFRHPGGPSHEQTLRAIRRFGEEVLEPLGAAVGRG